ncbi:MAG: pyridoxamine 5'-phosphate oxidase family protein [Sulfuricella sp.]|nr:pyridoxamine 5'-phosphate oxidase family protein [Sulfuricella sp.]
MKIPLESAIRLIHETANGTLATHSLREPGYPFATILPFAADAGHNPLFLMSGLAEHTKNLAADPRCSFLVNTAQDGNVQTGARLTLIGNISPVEADKGLVARFLRYHPATEQYLSLGDFTFYRLEPIKLRYIGGFGQAGWLDQAEWQGAAALPLAEEAAILRELDIQLSGKPRLLGIDCYGVDFESAGKRERQNFPDPPLASNDLPTRAKRLLAALP